MFTQQFRRLEACRSKLRAAVLAELAAETEERGREAERVKAENKLRAAAVSAAAAAAAAAAQRVTPTALDATDEEDDGANNDGGYSREEDGGDDDGYDSEVLVPVSPTPGRRREATMPVSRTSSPPPSSSSSRGRLTVSRPEEERGEPPTALSGGRVPTPRSTGASAGGATAATRKRSRSAAIAAATTSASAPKGGGARAILCLEDLLPAPGQARRSKARARADTTGRRGGTSRKKKQREEKEPAAPSPSGSGPFSGLFLCVVHLGSVTRNTIKAFEKGVRSMGGQLSTRYTHGDTTHIVADRSLALSWDKLDEYFRGWDDFEDVGATAEAAVAAGAGAGTPPGIPIVSSDWMSECLRLSAVVATDAYVLVPPPPPPPPPPPHCAAAAAAAEAAGAAHEPIPRTAGKSSTGGGGGAAASCAAATAAPAAAAAGKRKLASTDEDTGRPAAASVHPPARKQARGAVEGGAPANLQSGEVEGGHGARDPNVGEKRHAFFCQATRSGPLTVFNEEAAQQLERLANLCAAQGGDGSVFRERTFKKAAGVLRRLGVQIADIQQLKDLRKNEPERVRGIGVSVMKELTTFYEEGRMGRVEGLEADPKLRCLELFQKVSWVGPKKAEELYNSGLRSIEDLRAKGRHLLTEQAKTCLNRHEDISQRMPRSEAAEIEAMVTTVAQSICPGVICQACGSYRRGKSHCGDVDVLIRPPEGQENVDLLLELVSRLTSSGFMTDKLTMPDVSLGKPQSYMGICKLPGEGRLHRRLDIKVYPTSMFAFAVLYFTGSGHFNMSMRAFAKAKGLKLSDKGLCKVNFVNGKEVYKFDSYSCLREEDVFAALGMEWREPKDRDGVQVDTFSGRVVPVPSAFEQQQQQQRAALLQQQMFSGAEHAQEQGQEQSQEQGRLMQRQAAAYFEQQQQQEEEELQQAILFSRGAFEAGAGAAGAAARAGAAGTVVETGNHGNDYEDQMVQEAVRRSVADAAAATTRRLGGDDEVWETLPPEATAGGGGTGGGGGSSARGGGGGGGAGGGGGSGVGAGTEDSPLCL